MGAFALEHRQRAKKPVFSLFYAGCDKFPIPGEYTDFTNKNEFSKLVAKTLGF